MVEDKEDNPASLFISIGNCVSRTQSQVEYRPRSQSGNWRASSQVWLRSTVANRWLVPTLASQVQTRRKVHRTLSTNIIHLWWRGYYGKYRYEIELEKQNFWLITVLPNRNTGSNICCVGWTLNAFWSTPVLWELRSLRRKWQWSLVWEVKWKKIRRVSTTFPMYKSPQYFISSEADLKKR